MAEEAERIYTIPLKDVYRAVRAKKARAAVKFIRAFLARHMKTDEENVRMSAELNSYIWKRGIKKPPRVVRVKAKKDSEGKVHVSLQEEKLVEAKKEKPPEAKKEGKAPEAKKKEKPPEAKKEGKAPEAKKKEKPPEAKKEEKKG